MSLESGSTGEEEPQFSIDIAKPGEGEEITRVHRESWLAAYETPKMGLTREDIESSFSPDRVERWEKSIEEQGDQRRVWVERMGTKIVGFCTAEKTADKREVNAIYTLPSCHGKNVGRGLFENALTWLGTERDIIVWVFTNNDRAIAFYRKFGFVESGKSAFLEIAGKKIPDIEMIRKAQRPMDTNS
jgi:ribosomal protein S18 acetylase RimI-like enzyme